ncbi:MAG: hypothetical protein JNN32_11445 [Flavobacteriales bacterium]|nr:hypothetical protein [Flavobacteriales bacterium]
MYRTVIGALALALLIPACKKEEVKEYTVSLKATCYDCIVQYASGPDRGRFDTLFGAVNGSDTLRTTRSYTLTMREEEALFFRACRLNPDSGRFGALELMAEGDIQSLMVEEPQEADCAVINQAVQFR